MRLLLAHLSRYHPRNPEGFPVRVHPPCEKPRSVFRRVGEPDEVIPILPYLVHYGWRCWTPGAIRNRLYHWLGMSAYPRPHRCVMRDCKRGRHNIIQTCGHHYPAPGHGRFEI